MFLNLWVTHHASDVFFPHFLMLKSHASPEFSSFCRRPFAHGTWTRFLWPTPTSGHFAVSNGRPVRQKFMEIEVVFINKNGIVFNDGAMGSDG
jgi:hypothetical protein